MSGGGKDQNLEDTLEIATIVEGLAQNRRQFAVEVGDGVRELGAIDDEGFVVRLENVAGSHGEGNEELLEFFEHAYDPGAQGPAENAAYLNLLQLGKFEDGIEQPLDISQPFEESVEASEDGGRIKRPRRGFRHQAGHVLPQFELSLEFLQDS